MNDIDALQSRIMAALERIGQGLDELEPAGAAAEIESLRQQIADEKKTSTYLEERFIQASEQLHETRQRLAALQSEVAAREKEDAARVEQDAARAEADATREEVEAARKAALKVLDQELQALRQANQQLRDNNAALRKANADGLADPALIDKAMSIELDGLRASHAADRAEIDVILTELGQIVGASDNDRGRSAPSAGMEDT